MKKMIAAFDFDGTLTIGGQSSRIMFIRHLAGLPKLIRGLFSCYCLHSLSKFKLIAQQYDASYVDHFFLAGLDKQALKDQADIFVKRVLTKYIRQEAIERLRFHQQQGHTCVVISGAWDIYLKPWAIQHNIEHIICTELEFDPVTNKSTGRMLSNYCLGQEKVERLKKLYNHRDDYTLYMYGDSSHDLEILNYADYAFYRRFE